MQKRIREHESKYSAKSIPLFIWERFHPKQLEKQLLSILHDQKLKILYISGVGVEGGHEFFPISYDILETIFENMDINSSTWIGRDGGIDQIYNDDDLQNFVDNCIDDLQNFDDDIIVLDNVNDSLSVNQYRKIKQNPILGIY